ncbi:protein SRC2-like protein [Senna tora]|uniref:Protein SRC2-like protein n=1 Tax=Senna tora TaxID=362788 RepID=A0A834XEL9_9FABA|nr:protein SRC2-like protein [Senna tora]
MASRYELELKIASAKNLKNVNWRHGPNRPYAVVWVDPKNKCSTRVDESGDTEAFWDETLLIPLPPGPIEDFTLYIDVVHAGSEEDTKPLIGSARLKLSQVLEEAGIGDRATHSLTLKRPSGRPQGKVEVSVTIREIGYRAPGSYYAPPYGVPPPYGYAYGGAPPQAAGYPYSGYNAPAAPAYGQPSYGYDQGVYGGEEKKKSKFGGMGTGLAVGAVAGALGGLALVEGVDALEDHIADEAAEKVEDDLGYDDGGDDF